MEGIRLIHYKSLLKSETTFELGLCVKLCVVGKWCSNTVVSSITVGRYDGLLHMHAFRLQLLQVGLIEAPTYQCAFQCTKIYNSGGDTITRRKKNFQ